MSILNVNTIQPVGSAQTVTVSATDLKIGSTTLKSSGGGTFIGDLTGNVNSSGVSTVTTLKVSTLSPISSAISVSGTLTAPALDIPYANLARATGYTVASGGWSDITWTSIVTTKYITATASSANIQFQYPGTYRISVGWRFGTGGDVWTSLRLVDSGTERGLGYGTGQVTNDPGPCEIGLVATIPSNRVNTNMTIQFYRGSSTMAIGNPDAGYAVNCIINYIGV